MSLILRCWMRGLLLLWTRSSRSPTSRKRSVWRNKKLRKKMARGCGPQGRSSTGGGGPRGSRTCRKKMARGDAVHKAGLQQAAAGHEGPEPAGVLSPSSKVAHAGEEGRINVLPWYRLVRVVSTSSETQGGKTGLPARVNGRHVVRGWQSSPIRECAQVTGKTGENGQNSGEMGGSSQWTRPSAPGVVTPSIS